MQIVFLKFSENKGKAKDFIEAHNQWLEIGFEKHGFQIAGSIKPNSGGAIIANLSDANVLEEYIKSDPFIVNNIVTYELAEISINRASELFKDWK